MDYVFCYKDIDLNNAILKYWFDKVQHIEFKHDNGKMISKSEIYSPTIDFSITAEDENEKIYAF
ncbi:MAG: hypothetical protein PHX04_05285 [Bacilli bacterium]|nr:hypothetical protein [Bacilli bacterium]